jgi:hypothetical protein
MTCEPRTLVLYHTEGCHLCEQAEALLLPFAQARGWRLERVDIATEDALIARYGVRIPVVCDETRGVEIGWPFGATELARVLG